MPYEHTPASRKEWEILIRRAELPTATKSVAFIAATYGNPDGSRVGPSVSRLAVELGWSQKHIKTQLSLLRHYGLIEATRQPSPDRPTRYRLSFPKDLTTVPMRTDIDGYPMIIGPRKPPRGGRPPNAAGTPVPAAGTPVPGEQAAEGNSSSSDELSEQNSSAELEFQPEGPSDGTGVPDPEYPTEPQLQHTGTPVPAGSEPEFQVEGPSDVTGVPPTESAVEPQLRHRGTPVPAQGNSDSPDPNRPNQTTPMSGTYLPPTSAQPGSEPSKTQPVDPETAHRRARVALDAAPKAHRDLALAQAAGILADRDLPDRRRRTIILAGQIIQDWWASNLAPTTEGDPRP